jgi:K+-transporting ATPase KdpF subunit
LPTVPAFAQALKGTSMILLTAIVTVLLFVYLLAALLRPDWF